MDSLSSWYELIPEYIESKIAEFATKQISDREAEAITSSLLYIIHGIDSSFFEEEGEEPRKELKQFVTKLKTTLRILFDRTSESTLINEHELREYIPKIITLL